jgi:protein arginine kinase activator
MFCENCHQNIADTHIQHISESGKMEMHLCASCAKKLGIVPGHIEGPQGFDIGDFLSGVMSGTGTGGYPNQLEGKECGFCHSTLADISAHGKMGCANCYKEFGAELEPTLLKLHGSVSHTGKVPAAFQERIGRIRQIALLQSQLESAIKEQEFEEAAQLRDRIIELKKDGEKT